MHTDKIMLTPFAIMELAAATGVIVAAVAGLVRQVEHNNKSYQRRKAKYLIA